MSNPCLTDDCTPVGVINRWNWFKWLVLAGLILLALLALRACALTVPTLALADNSIEAGETALLSGSADAGTTIEILQDGEVIGETTADSAGEWSYSVPTDTAGDYEFTAQAVDGNGEVFGPSTGQLLAVSAPEIGFIRPTLDLPTGSVAADSIALSGRATPGSTIELYNNGELVDTISADDNGDWSVTVGDGRYLNDFRIRNFDRDGGELGLSPTKRLLIPSALASLALASDPQIGEFDADDDGNSIATLALLGTGEPGSTIQFWLGDQQIGTTTVSENGTWSYEGDFSAQAGDFDVVTRMVAANGDILGESAPFALTIPDLSSAGLVAPTIGSVEADGDVVTVQGIAAPDGDVQILVDGEVVDTVSADADGNWSYTGQFANGDYEISAMTSDASGATAATDVEPVTVAALIAPTIGSVEVDGNTVALQGTTTPNGEVEITVDGEVVDTVAADENGTWLWMGQVGSGEHEVGAQVTDGSGAAASATAETVTIEDSSASEMIAVRLVEGGAVSADETTFIGSATPGSQVEVLIDGNLAGTVTADENGTWRYSAQLPAGDHTISARGIDADGERIVTDEQAFVVGEVESATVSLQMVSGGTSADDPLQLSGTALPNATVDIVMDGEVVASVVADEDGNWQYETVLPEGEHTVTVRTSDPDGVLVSAETVPYTIQIGSATSADALLTASAPTVDADSQMLTLAGTAAPNSQIQIAVNDGVVAIVTADANGNWSYSGPQPAGDHTISARLIDADSGTVLTASPPQAFTIDAADVADSSDPDAPETTFQLAYADWTNIPREVLPGTPAIELILDASWSMSQQLGSSTRIASAKSSLEIVVRGIIPADTIIAFRAFGNIEGDYSCRTDLMSPPQALNRDELLDIIADINPRWNANTPLARSLELVAEDLADVDGPKMVVLVTDGEETCDGDPAAAIQALTDQGIDVRIDIVGLSIADEALKATFAEWAELGGGQYYDANDSEQLSYILYEVFLPVFNLLDGDGNIVATGRLGGLPIPVPPGTYTVELLLDPIMIIENVVIEAGEAVRQTVE